MSCRAQERARAARADHRRTAQALVLENLLAPFTRPNVIDIKLGTVLFDASAPPAKRARMETVARTTTSGATGMRLTGFQVHDAAGAPELVHKSYGRALTPGTLPAGIRRAFPCADSDEGRGLPWRTWEVVQVCVVEELRAMRAVLAATEVRMVGASVLVVYESDPRAAEVAAARLVEYEDDDAEERAPPLRDTTQGAPEDADADDAPSQSPDADDDSDSDSDDEEHEPGRGLYAVRLIDFAHSVPAPGRGPDLGVVQGIDTLIGLLVARGDALRAAAADSSRRAKSGAAAALDEARRREAGGAAAASL
jgi:1D-myo-inositol-tetrakisphosphate 5-kinase/inositol-polyphosphate multikinase